MPSYEDDLPTVREEFLLKNLRETLDDQQRYEILVELKNLLIGSKRCKLVLYRVGFIDLLLNLLKFYSRNFHEQHLIEIFDCLSSLIKCNSSQILDYLFQNDCLNDLFNLLIHNSDLSSNEFIESLLRCIRSFFPSTISSYNSLSFVLLFYVNCLNYISKLFEICVNECLLSVYKRVQIKATNVLKTVIKTILKPQVESLRNTPLLKQLFQIVEHGLTYAYTLSWNYVLHLLGDMFELMGKDSFEFCRNCLASLAGLRSTKDFSFLAELDSAVGKAIHVFGPEKVLSIIPLNLTGTIKDVQLEQSWLLPLLRDNISHTELSHFVSYFLPVAFQLQTTG